MATTKTKTKKGRTKKAVRTIPFGDNSFYEKRLEAQDVLLDSFTNPRQITPKQSSLAKLANIGILGSMPLDKRKIMIYEKGNPNCRMLTYMFRLPQLPGNPEVDSEIRTMLIKMKDYIFKWIIKEDDFTKDELCEILALYTPNHCFVTIMENQKMEFEKDSVENNIKYRILSPNIQTVLCPSCSNVIDVHGKSKFGDCHECGLSFKI